VVLIIMDSGMMLIVVLVLVLEMGASTRTSRHEVVGAPAVTSGTQVPPIGVRSSTPPLKLTELGWEGKDVGSPERHREVEVKARTIGDETVECDRLQPFQLHIYSGAIFYTIALLDVLLAAYLTYNLKVRT
jgi:hypothetical protein